MSSSIGYASSDTNIESLILHTLPNFGDNGDGIINQNLLLAALRKKGRQQTADGGLEFWYGVIKAENSNFKWQGKSDDLTVGLQDPVARLRFDIKVFTGALVVNELEKAQNKGKAMIKEYVRTLRDQAESTIVNQFNSAFWTASPGTNEPESVPSLVSATPTTGTIGGLSRAGNAYLQNGSDSTSVTDLGSEAGMTYLKQMQIKYAISANDMADLIICTDESYASLVGYLATLNRYMPADRTADFDFDAIKMGKTLISFEPRTVANGENGITDGYLYGLNTKYLYFKVLADGNFKWGTDFERRGNSLEKFLPFYVFGNLCTNLPKAHFVCTSVTG